MLKTPLKLILIGDGRVGKTSIINKYINNKFNEGEEITVSSSYIEKIQIFNSKKYKFSIWDTAGQEIYRSIGKIFYKEAKVIILVYDITDKKSFQEIKDYWYKQVIDNAPSEVNKF